MGRDVTLVLVSEDGGVLGALPAFPVELPWWQEVAEIVTEALRRYAVTVEVLRILWTENDVPHGGAVTYLAEVVGDVGIPLAPVDGAMQALAVGDEPLRASYAQVGGPGRSLRWARSRLSAPMTSAQQRTWNLSAIWRLSSPAGTSWLKHVPTFFAHEATVLRWIDHIAPGTVPRLLAADEEGRMLLEDVPGADLYDAGVEVRDQIAATAHPLHLASVAEVDSLVAAGVPDRRGVALVTWLRETLAGPAADHPALTLLDTLDSRMAEVTECGLPDVLVHGDSHPGNAFLVEDRIVLIDWGDSSIGHPAFDALRLCVGLDESAVEALLASWAARWTASVPGSEPLRALALLRPVEDLRLAAVYVDFLANIEPTERRYHAADVRLCLDAAISAR